MSRAEAWRAAARRFGTAVGALGGLTAVGSVIAGLLADAPLGRSLATGFYLMGSFLVVLGVFAGVRGPLRPKAGEGRDSLAGLLGIGIFGGGARRATEDERVDAVSTTWFFLTLGLALIVIGILVDERARII